MRISLVSLAKAGSLLCILSSAVIPSKSGLDSYIGGIAVDAASKNVDKIATLPFGSHLEIRRLNAAMLHFGITIDVDSDDLLYTVSVPSNLSERARSIATYDSTLGGYGITIVKNGEIYFKILESKDGWHSHRISVPLDKLDVSQLTRVPKWRHKVITALQELYGGKGLDLLRLEWRDIPIFEKPGITTKGCRVRAVLKFKSDQEFYYSFDLLGDEAKIL